MLGLPILDRNQGRYPWMSLIKASARVRPFLRPKDSPRTQAISGEPVVSKMLDYHMPSHAPFTPSTVPPADETTFPQPEVDLINEYWHAANYLSVGQIYLTGNPLLQEKLTLDHIKKAGTTTTPFDMTVPNEFDRFQLASDANQRAPRLGNTGGHLRQTLRDRLLEHRPYVCKHGEDMPDIASWRWKATNSADRLAP